MQSRKNAIFTHLWNDGNLNRKQERMTKKSKILTARMTEMKGM
nr:MAG TPA: hypothetical protein [Caudoviricetes sp.]